MLKNASVMRRTSDDARRQYEAYKALENEVGEYIYFCSRVGLHECTISRDDIDNNVLIELLIDALYSKGYDIKTVQIGDGDTCALHISW